MTKIAKLMSLLLLATGCMATVSPAPQETVLCMDLSYMDHRCNPNYTWVPGYWGRDAWGRRVWVRPRYVPRRPTVRDHRR